MKHWNMLRTTWMNLEKFTQSKNQIQGTHIARFLLHEVTRTNESIETTSKMWGGQMMGGGKNVKE